MTGACRRRISMITFRELQRNDLTFLLDVRNECRAMLHDDSEFTLAQAQDWFDVERPRFYLILKDGVPIGYFRTSNWDEKNRTVYVGCDLHKDHRGRGLAQMAYQVFLRFVFDELGMNKVSCEVLDIAVRSRHLKLRLGFTIEGVKRQEVWRNGTYLNSTMMSMLRSEFYLRYGCAAGSHRPEALAC